MNSQYFSLFLEEANELWPEAQSALADLSGDWRDIFLRVAHTLKGMAGTMGYGSLAEAIHELEHLAKSSESVEEIADGWQAIGQALDIATATQMETTLAEFPGTSSSTTDQPEEKEPASAEEIDTQANKPTDISLRVPVSKLDKLFEMAGQLHTRLRVLGASDYGSAIWQREMRHVQSLVARSLHHTGTARLSTMKPLIELFEKSMLDAADKTGKPANFFASGQSVRIAREVIERLRPLIPHMARNAIVHGIEDKDSRQKFGKPDVGRIEFSANQDGSMVIIRIRDDGGGVDISRLRAKAVEKGIDAPVDDQECLSLLFEPGFTTQSNADDLAGRGVGLDAVKEAVESVGGTVLVRHGFGQFFELQLSIPVSLSLQHLIEIDINGIPIGILDTGWQELESTPDKNMRQFTIPGIDAVNSTILANKSGYLRVRRWQKLGAVHLHRLTAPLNQIPKAIGFYLDLAGVPRIVYKLS